MYVTEDTTRARSRHAATAVLDRDSRRRDAGLHLGHRRPRDARRRRRGHPVRRAGGRRTAAADVGIDWHGHRDRDLGRDELDRRDRRRRDARPRRGDRHRRARRQHADGHADRQPHADGLHRATTCRRSSSTASTSSRGDRRGDSAELPGRRARRVPDGNRRPRRRGHQGVPQGRSRARRRASTRACPPAWSAASRRSRSGRCPANRTSIFWLEKRGLPVTDDAVDRIFAKAKASASVLREDEILQALDPHSSRH